MTDARTLLYRLRARYETAARYADEGSFVRVADPHNRGETARGTFMTRFVRGEHVSFEMTRAVDAQTLAPLACRCDLRASRPGLAPLNDLFGGSFGLASFMPRMLVGPRVSGVALWDASAARIGGRVTVEGTELVLLDLSLPDADVVLTVVEDDATVSRLEHVARTSAAGRPATNARLTIDYRVRVVA